MANALSTTVNPYIPHCSDGLPCCVQSTIERLSDGPKDFEVVVTVQVAYWRLSIVGFQETWRMRVQCLTSDILTCWLDPWSQKRYKRTLQAFTSTVHPVLPSVAVCTVMCFLYCTKDMGIFYCVGCAWCFAWILLFEALSKPVAIRPRWSVTRRR